MNKEMLEKVRNNIGKECVIKGHAYIQDGTKGIIKDVVVDMEQYLVIVGSDILYVPMEMVEIVQPKWEDIKGTRGYLGSYIYKIQEDGIVTIENENSEDEEIVTLCKLSKDTLEKIRNKEVCIGSIERYINAKITLMYSPLQEDIKSTEEKIKTPFTSKPISIKNITDEHYDFVDELLKILTGGKTNGKCSIR